MAVIFYAEGEHPTGFVGYRVATTLGTASEFRQRYFSLSQYSAHVAERLANELDEQWRDQADEVRSRRRLTVARGNCGPGRLVTGLRAVFRVERGRKAHYGTYITPMFVVQVPGHGAGERRFSIPKLGFDDAFTQAVDYYSAVNGISETERNYLLSLKPGAELFTGVLLDGLNHKGMAITAEQVRVMLGIKE